MKAVENIKEMHTKENQGNPSAIHRKSTGNKSEQQEHQQKQQETNRKTIEINRKFKERNL